MNDRRRDAITNSSPWAIGMSHYDQRDLYTTSASTDDDGYGRGPSYHPEEGSYAYHREFHPGPIVLREGNANLYEREAWPWLNYSATDPYFAHINELHSPPPLVVVSEPDVPPQPRTRSGLQAIKAGAAALVGRLLRLFRRPPSEAVPPEKTPRTDAQLRWDVERALLQQPDLDDHDIAVDVVHAEVTLEGTVSERRERRAAGKIAAHVPGVRTVHNHLEIREDDTTDGDMALANPFAFGA